ncbi:hypothetical protein [Ruegeria arenilitoris]|uniref:hypothetical protein n=1 Tax=Ruegeria arenilitoris TaxID=1173585 RepID=UPI00147B7B87|nr:hypothetical protein [Ruegeria arenilitoris]
MITRIARIDTETDIASLARSLYRVTRGRGGENLMKRAEIALVAANPSLSKAEGLEAGRRIIVPQVDGLALTARATAAGEAIGDPAAEALSRLGQIAISLQLGEETTKLRRARLLEKASGTETRKIFERELTDSVKLLDEAIVQIKKLQEAEALRLTDLSDALDAARDAFDTIAQHGANQPGRRLTSAPTGRT